MPTLSIVEYVNIGASQRGALPFPEEPAIATQTVSIGPTSTSSLPLHPETRLVRIVADRDCYIAVTDAPDATKSQRLLPAGQEQTLSVSDGLSIAVIAASSNATGTPMNDYDSLGALLQIVANPTAAKKALEVLQAESAKSAAIKQDLVGAVDLAKLAKDLDNREHALSVREAVVEALRLELKAKSDAIKALA